MKDNKTIIKDIEDLQEFIKLNKKKEDYLSYVIEKAKAFSS